MHNIAENPKAYAKASPTLEDRPHYSERNGIPGTAMPAFFLPLKLRTSKQ